MKSGQAQKLFFGDLSVGDFNETEMVRKFVLSQGVPSDKFVVTWHSDQTGNEDVYARLFAGNGTGIIDDFPVTSSPRVNFNTERGDMR